MVHLRGHHKDYENWSNITGDQRWGWEGVLPYFKSYENHEEAFDVDSALNKSMLSNIPIICILTLVYYLPN